MPENDLEQKTKESIDGKEGDFTFKALSKKIKKRKVQSDDGYYQCKNCGSYRIIEECEITVGLRIPNPEVFGIEAIPQPDEIKNTLMYHCKKCKAKSPNLSTLTLFIDEREYH